MNRLNEQYFKTKEVYKKNRQEYRKNKISPTLKKRLLIAIICILLSFFLDSLFDFLQEKIKQNESKPLQNKKIENINK